MPNDDIPEPKKYSYPPAPTALDEGKKTIYGLVEYLNIYNPEKTIAICVVTSQAIKGYEPRNIGILAAACFNAAIKEPEERNNVCYIIIYNPHINNKDCTYKFAELVIRDIRSRVTFFYPKKDISCISLWTHGVFYNNGAIDRETTLSLTREEDAQRLLIPKCHLENFLDIPNLDNAALRIKPEWLRGVKFYDCECYGPGCVSPFLTYDSCIQEETPQEVEHHAQALTLLPSTAFCNSAYAAPIVQYPQLCQQPPIIVSIHVPTGVTCAAAYFVIGSHIFFLCPPNTFVGDASQQPEHFGQDKEMDYSGQQR